MIYAKNAEAVGAQALALEKLQIGAGAFKFGLLEAFMTKSMIMTHA